jgi:orotidine-5'-phosphate decarboxylase
MWETPPSNGPWVADCKTFDIPETVAACIRNAASGMVAISLCRRGGSRMIEVAEAAAAERGIRILWWNGIKDTLLDV